MQPRCSRDIAERRAKHFQASSDAMHGCRFGSGLRTPLGIPASFLYSEADTVTINADIQAAALFPGWDGDFLPNWRPWLPEIPAEVGCRDSLPRWRGRGRR